LNPEVPPALADLTMRLLAKQPVERPESAEAVIREIDLIELGLAPAPARRRAAAVGFALVAVALLGVLGWIFGPQVFRIATNKGELIITTDDPDVVVTIKNNGEAVEILDLRTKHKVNLHSGEYTVELSEGGERLHLNTNHFTLTRGGQKIVTVEPGTMRTEKTATVAKTGELGVFQGHEQAVSSVVCDHGAKLVVSGSWDGTVRLWNAATQKEISHGDVNMTSIRNVTISPDGKRVAAAGFDKTIRIWDIVDDKELRTAREPISLPEATVQVHFAKDGRVLIAVSPDGTIRSLSSTTGKNAPILRDENRIMGKVEATAVSADGRLLLCGCQDKLIHLWNLDSAEYDKRLAGHTGPVLAVALSANGRFVVSGSPDGTARVWNLANSVELHRLSHPSEVLAVAISADGKRLLTGCKDGSVHLWNVEREQEIQTFSNHKGRVWSVALSADGRLAFSAAEDKTIRMWGLPVEP
jgi:WD40 repeat protein